MGRFEDLIAQARDGDLDALTALETEFGGSTLREKAEKVDEYQSKYQKALPALRQQKLDELMERLSDDLKASGLAVGDLGDFDPDGLTLEQVQDKAKAKLDATQAAKLASAQEHGFASVEEYEAALEAVKQQKAARQEGMETVAGGVASSGGEPPGAQEPKTGREIGKDAFQEAKGRGETDDLALAHSVSAILEAQSAQIEE